MAGRALQILFLTNLMTICRTAVATSSSFNKHKTTRHRATDAKVVLLHVNSRVGDILLLLNFKHWGLVSVRVPTYLFAILKCTPKFYCL